MSSGHESQREQAVEAPSSSGSSGKSAAEVPPDVLAGIVAATAAQLATPAPTDPALHAVMLEVARQFAGQPMTVEPTGAALLVAILRHQIPLLQSRPRILNQAALTVAESLLNDPTARQRVEYLWAKLTEEIA